MIAQADALGQIDRRPVPLQMERQKQVDTLLSFPGKLLVDPEGKRLYVSDTDHHRVLCFGLDNGRLRAAYGAGEAGFVDGPPGRGRLNGPRGLALRGDALLVADTENHAVRRIALDSGVITTVAGTGRQAAPRPQPGPARGADLNSPWDVLVFGDRLFIAMAGSHQIWTLDLISGQLDLFAGDGREALLDRPRLASHLAQPSGLASDGEALWFVDSETSSLRSVPFQGEGKVRTYVGDGLFEFGDRDGPRGVARLQHPLGLACSGGLVYVADTYNNRIKALDPAAGEIGTLSGCGEPGLQDGEAHDASFWEPSGISAAGDLLFVADTNNHAVRMVTRTTGYVLTMQLQD